MKSKFFLLTAAVWFLSTPARAEPYAALEITSPSGQRSLLLGTMHVPYPGMVLPDPAILDGARAYVIEHTTADEKNTPQLAPEVLIGLQSKMDVVANWAMPLSEAQIDTLLERLNCSSPEKISRENFRMLLKLDSPRLVAQLAWLPCLPGQRKSRDQWMDEVASKYKVPVVSLETQDEVGARRLALPTSIYQKELFSALDANLIAAYNEVVASINGGNFEAAWAAARITVYTEDERQLFERIMVAERNALWIPRLIPVLDQGKAVILVGVAHLPGPRGVVALLKARGYDVQRVNLQGQAAE